MPQRTFFDGAALDSLIERERGVLSHREVRAVGLPASTFAYRIRAQGPWQRLLPGLVVTHNGPPTPRQRLLGALKYAGEDTVITGATALSLRQVRGAPRLGVVYVLVPHDHQIASTGFVIVERTRRMPAPAQVADVPCAPLPRATIDHCRREQSLDRGRAIIAEVVQRHGCSISELTAELREGSVRGSAMPRSVLKEIVLGVRAVSEAKARDTLRRLGVRQPDYYNCLLYDEITGEFIASPDGYYEDVGVAYEMDSMTFHLDPESYKRTQRRQRRMTSYGIHVLPVAPGDVESDPKGFGRSVADTLRSADGRSRPRVVVVPRSAA